MNERIWFAKAGFSMLLISIGFLLGVVSPRIAWNQGFRLEKTQDGFLVQFDSSLSRPRKRGGTETRA